MSERDRLDLPAIIRQVRRRWRVKLALRGATTVLAVGVLLLVAAAFGLQWARFNPSLVLPVRIALAVSFIVVVAVFMVRPMMRRVSDAQVALYIEEHEPALEAAIVSAVD